MTNDPMDLPTRKTVSSAPTKPRKYQIEIPLTEQHVGQMLEIGGQLAKSAVEIGVNLLEIVRIREQAQAEVSVIEAKTQAVVETIRAETEQLIKKQDGIPKRAQAATEVIQAVMKHIPDGDHEARSKAIDMLYELVRLIISEDNNETLGS